MLLDEPHGAGEQLRLVGHGDAHVHVEDVCPAGDLLLDIHDDL